MNYPNVTTTRTVVRTAKAIVKPTSARVSLTREREWASIAAMVSTLTTAESTAEAIARSLVPSPVNSSISLTSFFRIRRIASRTI